MSPRYLLDANVISEPLRPHPNPTVLSQLRTHREELVTATPVWHELIYGVHLLPPSRKRRGIERYLEEAVRAVMDILPYDVAAAAWHAAERARLSRIGRTPPFVDGQIAAIAHENGLILVTANVADYQNFNGLQVVDWRS